MQCLNDIGSTFLVPQLGGGAVRGDLHFLHRDVHGRSVCLSGVDACVGHALGNQTTLVVVL